MTEDQYEQAQAAKERIADANLMLNRLQQYGVSGSDVMDFFVRHANLDELDSVKRVVEGCFRKRLAQVEKEFEEL